MTVRITVTDRWFMYNGPVNATYKLKVSRHLADFLSCGFTPAPSEEKSSEL